MTAAILAEIRASTQLYYVYVLRKPDETPFYVGKGKVKGDSPMGERVFHHERRAIRTRKRHPTLCAIRKILRAGAKVVYEIDSWHATDESACIREVALISAIGRKDVGTGPLTNLTSGGDTPAIGPSARKNMSDAQRAYFTDPAARKKTSEATRRFFQEHPEVVEHIRRRAVERCKDMKVRKMLSASRKRYLEANPLAGATHSERLKRWYRENPERAAEIRRKRAESLKSPETRRRMSEANRRWRQQNPELAAARDRKGAEKRRKKKEASHAQDESST